jgi:ATP-dependent Clp protease ATP-binding subunit ClpA
MFERYTERARRVIFFARYEASQFGSMTIETGHLLLGLLREDKQAIDRHLRTPVGTHGIREDIEAQMQVREKVATSIDLPLSDECKRILAYAHEEAERLNHRHIGTEHLLLGMLREKDCVAAQVLTQRGLVLEELREELARNEPMTNHAPILPHATLPETGVVPDEDTAKRVAEAVWLPLFGSSTIQSQQPLEVKITHDVWIVKGTPSTEGGPAIFACIYKKDGRILSVGRGGAA